MCSERIFLQDWFIASARLDHKGSNSTGFFQNCGNCKKTVCFSSPNSVTGSPGRSLNLGTVHRPKTCVPKYTCYSFASLTESVPARDSPLRLRWRRKNESVVCKLRLPISLEESAGVLAFGRIGSALGKPFAAPP